MALIKQIRQRTGLAIGVIAGGLILFLLGGDLLSPNSSLLNTNQNIIGEIAGEEITLEELNQEVIKLNDLVARQQHQIMLMVSRLQAIEPSNMASQADETPPPHY